MEENAVIQLTDENLFPDEAVLQSVLGPGYAVYVEWRYYRDGKAWLGKAQHKKRTLVWRSALTGPDPLRELEAVMDHKQGTGGKR